jgi:hypothetical protein
LSFRVHKNVVTDEFVQDTLLLFDKNIGARHPLPEEIQSPYFGLVDLSVLPNKYKEQLFSILDKILDEPYELEKIYLYDKEKHNFSLHVDTGEDEIPQRLYKNVLIPIKGIGASTVIFENKWYHKRALFKKNSAKNEKITVSLNKISGENIIDDVRKLTPLPPHCQQPYWKYGLTKEQVYELLAFADIQEQRWIVGDYSEIEGYDPRLEINNEIYEKYLSSMTKDDFNGLTVDSIYDWNIGDVATWDRNQLHCGAGDNVNKKSLIIFTKKLS